MSIIKSKHASNYTVLPNEIFTSGISIEAIGLLSYFLSLPHNWVIYKTQLHSQLNIGREKLDRVFKELQEKRYLISLKEVNDKGQFTYSHIVYDKPYNGEPSTVKPCAVNQPLQSTKEQSTKEIKKHNTKELSFQSFWDLYDKKVGDIKNIESKYNKLTDSEIDLILIHLPKYIKSQPDKKYRKNPATYLNQKSWNDEIIGEKIEQPKVIYDPNLPCPQNSKII